MDQELVRLLKKAEMRYGAGEKCGWDADAVHDYRVAIRRARAYLKFWRAELPKRQKRLQEQLKRLQRQTAWVREWDVFLERFGEVLTDLSIEKGEFARLVQVLDWKETRTIWTRVIADGEKLKGKPFEEVQTLFARRVLSEADRKPRDWHRLRIRIKRYRYELERQAKLDQLSKPDQNMIEVLKEWQDRLGLIQDAETHQKWFLWLHEEEGLASLGNAAMKIKLIDEANRELPELHELLKRQ